MQQKNKYQIKLQEKQDFQGIIQPKIQVQQSIQNQNQICGKRWSLEQNVKLCLFMKNYQHIFKSKKDRQCLRIFKKLSNFLGTRSTRQCRSHFQKLMNRFKIPIKAIKHYENLYGNFQFNQQLLLVQNKLQPLCSKRKIRIKDIKKNDFSVQVDLDAQYNYQRNPSCHYYTQKQLEYNYYLQILQNQNILHNLKIQDQ